MDTKQFLRSILDSLQQIDYVKPEDVPNIDLYMDQVTTFLVARIPGEKLIMETRYSPKQL